MMQEQMAESHANSLWSQKGGPSPGVAMTTRFTYPLQLLTHCVAIVLGIDRLNGISKQCWLIQPAALSIQEGGEEAIDPHQVVYTAAFCLAGKLLADKSEFARPECPG
ncbi:hypothetical protein CDAR_195861 [Caerostris darwini]|uniref:Uncharacterized protein n=1 Tax=Caerostris darwini TaxID=1538125 RepID=A0AAV4WPS3_9ARAC|nr:hypothetical protein CDAR_195861 [Caerostris darwini]